MGKKKNRWREYTPDEGVVRKMLGDVMELVHRGKCETHSEYIQRFDWYFQHCIDADIKPTVEGFSMAMGWQTRQMFNACLNGRKGEWLQEFCRRGVFVVQNFMAAAAINGLLEPSIWIFYSKNYFGYRDDKSLRIEAEVSVNDRQYDAAVQQSIIEALPEADAVVLDEENIVIPELSQPVTGRTKEEQDLMYVPK